MIRILIVDDHPAMRTGLDAVLRTQPGFVPLGAVASVGDLWPTLRRTKPDVVVLDYHLPGDDGLVLCCRIKRELPAPAVLLYSAYAETGLAIAATLAGVSALVNKSAPATDLYDALRRVARGERMLPSITRDQMDAAAEVLAVHGAHRRRRGLLGHPARRDLPASPGAVSLVVLSRMQRSQVAPVAWIDRLVSVLVA